MHYKTLLKRLGLLAGIALGDLSFPHQAQAEQVKADSSAGRINTVSLVKYLVKEGELARPKEGDKLTFPDVYFKRKVEDTPNGFIVFGVCYTPSSDEIIADKEVHTRVRQRYGKETRLTEIVTSRTFVQDGGVSPISKVSYGKSDGIADYAGKSIRTNSEEGLRIPQFRESALTPEEKLAVYQEITGKFIGRK